MIEAQGFSLWTCQRGGPSVASGGVAGGMGGGGGPGRGSPCCEPRAELAPEVSPCPEAAHPLSLELRLAWRGLCGCRAGALEAVRCTRGVCRGPSFAQPHPFTWALVACSKSCESSLFRARRCLSLPSRLVSWPVLTPRAPEEALGAHGRRSLGQSGPCPTAAPSPADGTQSCQAGSGLGGTTRW